MRARLRGPSGTSTITLLDDATVADLIAQITEKTSIPSFDVKYGYPPRPLLLEQHEKSQPLSKLDVKLDGEQLTISVKEEPIQQTRTSVTQKDSSANEEKIQKGGQDASQTGASSKKENKPIALTTKKMMEGDVPELPLPDRGATLGKLIASCLLTPTCQLIYL